MTDITWIGTSGDWTDPNNWAGGQVPTATDTAEFLAGAADTVFGNAYVGRIDLNGATVLLAGDFAGDGVDPSGIFDGTSSSGTYGTLTVAPWASVAVDAIGLTLTDVDVAGLLQNAEGTVANITVDGSSAAWLSGGTTILSTLSIQGGGTVAGNLVLANDGTICCDSESSLQAGTLSVDAAGVLQFLNADGGSEAGDFSLSDAIQLAEGANLQVVCPQGSSLVLDEPISGEGSLEISGADISFGDQFVLAGQLLLSDATATSTETSLGQGTFVLTSSSLDLSLTQPGSTGALTVSCASGPNTVIGGGTALIVIGSSSQALDFTGGAGAATIEGGSAALSVAGSSGSMLVSGGTAGGTIRSGTGNDTVIGQSGLLDVSGGSGDDQIWGGSSGQDTISGGTGSDTLFGGSGTTITADGSEPTLLGAYNNATGVLLNASQSSGSDTLIGATGGGTVTLEGGTGSNVFQGNASTDDIRCGSGSTTVFAGSGRGDTIFGGSGNDIIYGGSAPMSVIGGSGNLVLYGSAAGYDTITGSTGNDTLIASSYSSVSAVGIGTYVLIAQGTAVTVNTGQATGSCQIELAGTGLSQVILGSGQNTVFNNGQAVNLQIAGGSDDLYAAMGAMRITLTETGTPGILDVFQFNPNNSVLVLPTHNYTESVVGGNFQVVCGAQTITFEGLTYLPPSAIVAGH
jgi:Ca2+-binding RTX toxin-like protein